MAIIIAQTSTLNNILLNKFMLKHEDFIITDDYQDRLCSEHKIMFGQIGISLMLDAFDRKYLDYAFEILVILHTYNINYYELELYSSELSSDADSFDLKILPFTIVFVAVDICLHFKRPKDAFTIFQDFSWVTPTENLNQEAKLYVLKERYNRLIQLVPLLNHTDSLHQGWEALKILLTAVEQGLIQETFEENNKDYIIENFAETQDYTKENSPEISGIRSIYNDYMISLINCNELTSAFNLYEHSLGPKKDIFIVKPEVLRGLVVAFSNSGKSEIAKSIFMRGLLAGVYTIKKPELSSTPWDLTIKDEWTVPEIKFVVDWFISMLSPLLSAKPKDTNFEEWFSLKIIFKVLSKLDSKVACLTEPGLDPKYFISKTKFALQSMNPSLQFIEAVAEEALCVTSESLYNYWKSKWCNESANATDFKKSPMLRRRQNYFSFGEVHASSEKEKHLIENTHQSPKHQEHFVENLVSEYIDEIRSKTSTGTLAPVSPSTSPNKLHQTIQNISPGTSFIPIKETSFDMQNYSKKLTDSIIQISNPSRLMDRIDKEYKIQGEKCPLFVNNTPPALSTSNNSKIENKFKIISPASSSTPKLQNNVSNTISKRRIKKLNKQQLNFKKVVNLTSTKKTNNSFNMKNLTVSVVANSSHRIVSNSSKNLEKVSHDNLENSQLSVKISPTDSSVLKPSKTSITENKANLNKPKNNLNKVVNRNSPKSSINVGSNIVMKVPVTNPNVNQAKQTQKESVIVVSKTSKVSETVSNTENSQRKELENSQFSVKIPPTDSSVLKPGKTSITENKANLNKPNNNLNKVVNRNSSKSSINVGSNVIMKVPVTSPNVNQAKQTQKESVIVVSKTSKVPETVSNRENSQRRGLENSQFSVKIPPTDSSVLKPSKLNLKPSKASITENKANLNKPNNNLNKVINPSKSSINVESNIVMKVPVTSPNVNQAKQAQKEPVNAVSKTSQVPETVLNEKISSAVISHSRDSVAVETTINSTQCKNPKSDIKRIFNVTNQDSRLNKNASFTITSQNKNSDVIVSDHKSVHCTISKPIIKRTTNLNRQNLVSNEKSSATVIPLNKDCSATVPRNTFAQVSKPVIKRSINSFFQSNNSSKTKVMVLSTSPSSSHAKSSVSFPQKEHVNLEKPKVTQLKIIDDTNISKTFTGNCDDGGLTKIINFLETKVALKHKHLLPEQQKEKALTLAQNFIKTNGSITKLDRKIMRMLIEFERINV